MTRWNLVPLLLICCARALLPQGSITKVNSSGRTVVPAVIGKSKIAVLLKTSTVDVGLPGKPDKSRRFLQCTYSVFPCVLTNEFKIVVDGRSIPVPYSTYADLGDMLTATITERGPLFELTIKGGDASESYIARISFDRTRVHERRLYSGEDPSHLLEVTQYYEVVIGD